MFRINSEADRLIKQLFEYASSERDRGVYDFTRVISGFYRTLNPEDNTKNFTNRLLKMMKDYVETEFSPNL